MSITSKAGETLTDWLGIASHGSEGFSRLVQKESQISRRVYGRTAPKVPRTGNRTIPFRGARKAAPIGTLFVGPPRPSLPPSPMNTGWRGARDGIGSGIKKWGWNSKKQDLTTAGYEALGSVARGAMIGVAGNIAYGAASAIAPNNFQRDRSVFSSAFKGALGGAILGGARVAGGGIRAAHFNGRYQGIANAGKMIRKASDNKVIRGALIAGIAGSQGSFSMTRPVNKGY